MSYRARFIAAALPLSFAACGDPPCPPGFTPGDTIGECAFDEPAVLDLVRTLEEGPLVKLNPEPYIPPYSSNPIARNVWVSPVAIPDEDTLASDLYLSIDQDEWATPLDVAFPVGTVIVHEAVNGEEAHGVEVKRDDYVDETGRPWWMAMVFDDGEIDVTPREACADCHTAPWRPTEGLWGLPTSAK